MNSFNWHLEASNDISNIQYVCTLIITNISLISAVRDKTNWSFGKWHKKHSISLEGWMETFASKDDFFKKMILSFYRDACQTRVGKGILILNRPEMPIPSCDGHHHNLLRLLQDRPSCTRQMTKKVHGECIELDLQIFPSIIYL